MLPLLINTAQRNVFLWNVIDDGTIDSTYCKQCINLWHYSILFLEDNSSPNTGAHTHGDLRCSFQLVFPYCARVVTISSQKLCVTIKH